MLLLLLLGWVTTHQPWRDEIQVAPHLGTTSQAFESYQHGRAQFPTFAHSPLLLHLLHLPSLCSVGKRGCWKHKVCLFVHFSLLAKVSYYKGETVWQAVKRDVQGHQKSHQQRGTEVPRLGKATRSTSGCSQSRDQQDHSTRRGGSHLPPDAEESETSFLFLFWGENSFFKLSIIFSLTPSREQTVLFVSDSQILNPLFPLLVTHESDSFTSR